MLNANTEIQIPVLVSNKGYGVFWDNYSTTNFAGNASGNTQYSFSSETGDLVDYYFFYGPTIDQVIARYRITTGAAPLFPKWAYGLFQSKDHYQSSAELTDRRAGLSKQQHSRRRHRPGLAVLEPLRLGLAPHGSEPVPGSGRRRQPAPRGEHPHDDLDLAALSDPKPRDAHGRRASSITSTRSTRSTRFIPTTTSGGLYHFYDTFNAMARTLIYQYDHDRLIGKYGWDAIWADNTEPQSYPDGVNVHAANTALGKGAFYINAYPLEHNRALYEGWRSMGPNNKRVYILTRSAFAGQQRYRGWVLVGGHQRHRERLRRADPGRPRLRHLRDAVLDDRHRRLLRNPQRGALHPLVPVRRLLPHVPHPRPGAQGALWLAVERVRARPTCSPSTSCATA